MSRPLHLALATLTGLALVSAPASAKKLKVPAPYPTIQEAVDAAGAGDTVLVASGTYVGNVVIPAAKVGLVLKGKGAVTLEPSDEGPVIRVDAPDARIVDVTVRHAHGGGYPWGSGVYVSLAAVGVELEDVSAVRCEFAGFFIDGPHTTLASCRAVGDGVGFMAGHDVRFVGCEALTSNSIGFYVSGDRVEIVKCAVRGKTGIYVLGLDPLIEKCELRCSLNGAILLGSRAVFRKNLIEGCSERGVDAKGSEDDIRDNVARECGTGFGLGGQKQHAEGNLARDCFDDGFAVHGEQQTLIDNRSLDNGADGFDVHEFAYDLSLLDNVALGNHGEGIENSGHDTILVDNTSKKNRLDLANDGSIMTFDGNSYQTGGLSWAPEID